MDIDKALLEDPNIYEYDAVYDEVQASKPKVGAKDKDKNNVDKKVSDSSEESLHTG